MFELGQRFVHAQKVRLMQRVQWFSCWLSVPLGMSGLPRGLWDVADIDLRVTATCRDTRA